MKTLNLTLHCSIPHNQKTREILDKFHQELSELIKDFHAKYVLVVEFENLKTRLCSNTLLNLEQHITKL